MMKFRVVGSNVKTSARVVIEVEAQNRAAAERAASAAGIEVLHVEQVPDDPLASALRAERPSQRGEHAESSRRALWIVLLVVAVAVAIGVIWWIRGGSNEP